MWERRSGHLNNRIKRKTASIEAVRKFLNRYNFDGYQAMDLPHGFKIEGMDISKRVDAVYKYPVKGKTVLDVGCKYGYFCHEAILRGAAKAVGIEINKQAAIIGQEIADLWRRDITILNSDLYDLDASAHYDIVLFLNVLHHLISPVEAMEKLAQVTNELLIVEFSTLLDSHIKMNILSRTLYKKFFLNTPLAYIGSREYHRVWYFSKTAFDNLFIKQMNLFKKVEFCNSPRKKGRLLAYCWI